MEVGKIEGLSESDGDNVGFKTGKELGIGEGLSLGKELGSDDGSGYGRILGDDEGKADGSGTVGIFVTVGAGEGNM